MRKKILQNGRCQTLQNSHRQSWSDYMVLRGQDDNNRNEDLTFFSYAWYMLNHGLAN